MVLQHLRMRYGSVRKLAIRQGLVRAPYIGASRGEQPIPVALKTRLCEILPEELLGVLRGYWGIRANKLRGLAKQALVVILRGRS